MKSPKAVVVHSGGMDSSLCLAIAVKRWGSRNVISLSFNYQQRHSSELKAAKKIAKFFEVKHHVIDLTFLTQLSQSSLIHKEKKISWNKDKSGQKFPSTLVVGRNGLMARIAGIFAHSLGAKYLYFGVMELETANSGYRDCSREYFDLIQKTLRKDFADNSFKIETPLVKMDKSQSMMLGFKLGVLPFLLENTVTCYEGIPQFGCGKCPACQLRNEGIRVFLKQIKSIKNFTFSWIHKL